MKSKCSFCDKEFEEDSDLMTHFRTEHMRGK
jgi:hypothetical protein